MTNQLESLIQNECQAVVESRRYRQQSTHGDNKRFHIVFNKISVMEPFGIFVRVLFLKAIKTERMRKTCMAITCVEKVCMKSRTVVLSRHYVTAFSSSILTTVIWNQARGIATTQRTDASDRCFVDAGLFVIALTVRRSTHVHNYTLLKQWGSAHLENGTTLARV